MNRDFSPGEFYTVKSGRFKGRTGRAVKSPHGSCHILWFPELGEEISFFQSSSLVRKATATEELRLRRWMDDN